MESGRSGPLDSASADGSLNSSAFNDLKLLHTSSPVFSNSVDGVREISSEPREKKSSFKITRIVSRNGNGGNEDSDSIDDRTGLDDLSSDVTDISQSTNVVANIDCEDTIYSSMEDVATGLPPLLDEPKESVPPPTPQDEFKEKDVHSRFRLVKIDNQECVRHGRWNCLDFNDSVLLIKSVEEPRSGGGPSPKPDNICEILQNSNHASICVDLKPFSRQPSESSSVGQVVFPDSAHVAVGSNASSQASCSPQPAVVHLVDPLSMPVAPLVPSLSSTSVVSLGKERVTDGFQGEVFPLDVHPSSNSNFMENGDFMSRFQSFQFVTGNLLSNMTRKRSEASDLDMLDESGASAVAIDNKIEQAMDLVKSHLMFAVREEVEQLKLKIQELTERNSQLEYENSILRASAPQETLAKLQRPQSVLPS